MFYHELDTYWQIPERNEGILQAWTYFILSDNNESTQVLHSITFQHYRPENSDEHYETGYVAHFLIKIIKLICENPD